MAVMTTKPDIIDLIDYQIRMATDGSAPTLWFTHAIPALRQAQREIRRLRKLQGETAPEPPPEPADSTHTLFGEFADKE